MIEYTEPPERIAGIRRRQPNQTRLFDTQEIQSITEELAEGGEPAELDPISPKQ
jgi:hypothetical protein